MTFLNGKNRHRNFNDVPFQFVYCTITLRLIKLFLQKYKKGKPPAFPSFFTHLIWFPKQILFVMISSDLQYCLRGVERESNALVSESIFKELLIT